MEEFEFDCDSRDRLEFKNSILDRKRFDCNKIFKVPLIFILFGVVTLVFLLTNTILSAFLIDILKNDQSKFEGNFSKPTVITQTSTTTHFNINVTTNKILIQNETSFSTQTVHKTTFISSNYFFQNISKNAESKNFTTTFFRNGNETFNSSQHKDMTTADWKTVSKSSTPLSKTDTSITPGPKFSVSDNTYTITTKSISISSNTASTSTTSESFLKTMSMAKNISMSYLKKNGMFPLYQGYYLAKLSTLELNSYLSCDKNVIVCIGGGPVKESPNGETFLDLVSCGDCNSISQKTEINKPRLINGAYWYFTPGYSFGWAPDFHILQEKYDIVDLNQDERRLSWIIDGFNGGGRLGKSKLENTKKFYKYIFSNSI